MSPCPRCLACKAGRPTSRVRELWGERETETFKNISVHVWPPDQDVYLNTARWSTEHDERVSTLQRVVFLMYLR